MMSVSFSYMKSNKACKNNECNLEGQQSRQRALWCHTDNNNNTLLKLSILVPVICVKYDIKSSVQNICSVSQQICAKEKSPRGSRFVQQFSHLLTQDTVVTCDITCLQSVDFKTKTKGVIIIFLPSKPMARQDEDQSLATILHDNGDHNYC